MAYSLADPYRPMRLVLRINGAVLGLLLGAYLLIAPARWLTGLGLLAADSSALGWRVAGVALLAFGLFLVLAAGVRDLDLFVLLPCLIFHALVAIVLLLAYLSGELARLGTAAGVGLVIVFVLCLVGALVPLRYFSAEYRF
jgi:hypothetical protein